MEPAMSPINYGALLSFVLITTFTPGPNNISSSSMGILYGYQKSLNYLLGIAFGFFGIMLLSGVISRTVYALFPSIESVLRIAGALYILWLAYKSLKTSYTFDLESSPPLGFANGVLLQAMNPKAWVYGLTLYTTFLASITRTWGLLIPSAVLLALVAFSAISTWALTGAAIRRFLHQSRVQRIINAILALLLAYTALEVSGIL
jgi:cysteine/O-acetylserine efflux protein